MGQRFGVPIPSESIAPFVNLPREAIESLWLSYNLVGEGWALNKDDFIVIVQNASYLPDKLGNNPILYLIENSLFLKIVKMYFVRHN